MAAGVNGNQNYAGVAALFAGIVVWMLQPEVSWAQDATTTTTTMNMSNFTKPCYTHCCDTEALRTEARLACQEFRKWGIQDSACVLWQLNAVRFCQESCSNCTVIAKAMYDQCLFFLQSQMDFTAAIQQCRIVESDFENAGRCNSVCNTTVGECHSKSGTKCMRDCGNFQKCECYMWRGVFGEPDTCSGATVLTGYIPKTNPLTKYSCQQIGEKCKNHREGRECGKYKWCTTDMCLVKNVSCPLTDTCQSHSACEKSTGECYYTLRMDGTPCTDSKHYTHDDECKAGTCVGWVDRCLKYLVQCDTNNPCLVTKGTCHPRTGACVFVKRPDGIPCNSAPGIAPDGTCTGGLCRRKILDRCANKNCSSSGSFCDKDPTCDPLTGQCVIEPRPEGLRCTDGNKKTNGDMCIEGQCIGHQFDAPKFTKVAEGFCADAQGHMLPRYFADTFDKEECEDQCAQDPACVAYSYGFHFCSVYGGARASHPSTRWWGYSWMLGNLWGDNSTVVAMFNTSKADGVVPALPSQQVVVCMKKVSFVDEEEVETPIVHEIIFGVLVMFLVCSPGTWMLLWKLRQHPEEQEPEDETFQDRTAIENLKLFEALHGDILTLQHHSRGGPDISPRGDNAAAVGQAPEMIEDDDEDEKDGEDDDALAQVEPDDLPAGDVPDNVSAGAVSDPRGEVAQG